MELLRSTLFPVGLRHDLKKMQSEDLLAKPAIAFLNGCNMRTGSDVIAIAVFTEPVSTPIPSLQPPHSARRDRRQASTRGLFS
jgi:hypothetical protein